MPEYVLDTVVLQVMTFSGPDGVSILLQGLATMQVRFPAEVYNNKHAVSRQLIRHCLPLPLMHDHTPGARARLSSPVRRSDSGDLE